MTREIYLGSHRLDRRGERISPEVLIDLRARKLLDILLFCPVASQLTNSNVSIDIYVLDGHIHMNIQLLENHEPQLFFTPATNQDGDVDPANGSQLSDPFALEYEKLHYEISHAPAELLVATSPVLTREEIQATSREAVNRRHRRKGTRVRGKAILELPGVEGPTRLEVPPTPKLLPAGTRLKIVAIVKDLPPKRALLKGIRVADRSAVGNLGIHLPDLMQARRQIHGPGASVGPLLLESRDHKMPIVLEVVVLDSWIDGEHLMLDIVSASRLTPAKPTNDAD